MLVDSDHLHHWMQAIRQSNNPMRTLDAFWSGQLRSKEWLIDCLDEHIHFGSSIDIHGGWVGVLASMLFQSNIPITHIRSVDIDPHVKHIAEEMNRIEFHQGRFQSITSDMCGLINYTADIVINTCCEHLTQEQYNSWLYNTPVDSLIVVQGNNYKIDEHVRPSKDIYEFKEQCQLSIQFIDTLKLPLYDRYMIIGKRHEY